MRRRSEIFEMDSWQFIFTKGGTSLVMVFVIIFSILDNFSRNGNGEYGLILSEQVIDFSLQYY